MKGRQTLTRTAYVFRHFAAHRPNRPAAAVFLCLALVGCTDEQPQNQIDSLRSSLATVNAEVESLRASRQVFQNRLSAAQIAARTAGSQLTTMRAQMADLAARNEALTLANAQGTHSLRAAQANVVHLNNQLAALRQSMNASEANNANLSRQLAALNSLLGQRNAVGQSQDNALKTLEGDLHERAESMVELSEELVSRNEALHKAETRAELLRVQNEQMSDRLAALQASFDTMSERNTQRISQLERERGELSATLAAMRADTQQETTSYRQLSEMSEQLKARMETMRNELADANNQALRYQVAKDYLNDKVQAQEAQIDALKKTANDLRTQHNATMTTQLKQHEELRAAASTRDEILSRTIARAEALQAERDGLREQLENVRTELTASEQRGRGAKQAKDYLDGKLAAISKELEEARSEHRTSLLKNEHALRLSLEESRVLQQRERALSAQFQQLQAAGEQQAAELSALRAEVEARIELARAAGLVDGKAEGKAELNALREEFDNRIKQATDAAFVEGKRKGRAERDAELRDEVDAKVKQAADAAFADGKSKGQAERDVELRDELDAKIKQAADAAFADGKSKGRAERDAELRDEVDAKIKEATQAVYADGKAAGHEVGLSEGRAEKEAELRTLRDQLDVRINLARATGIMTGKTEGREAGLTEGRAEGQAELKACLSTHDNSESALQEQRLNNESLSKEIETLKARLQEIESKQLDCVVQTMQSPSRK